MRNLCFSLKQLRKIGPADVEARSEFVTLNQACRFQLSLKRSYLIDLDSCFIITRDY